eukprot:10299834-Prorocentrum_lima.AAC.1
MKGAGLNAPCVSGFSPSSLPPFLHLACSSPSPSLLRFARLARQTQKPRNPPHNNNTTTTTTP